MALANRSLTLFALWAVAGVCYACKGTLSGLQQSREMLRIVLDAIPVRVFWKDRDLRYLGCNKRFAEDAGKKSADEIVGTNDSQLPWRNQEGFYRADEREVLETGRAKLNVDEPQSGPDASLRWRRTSRLPLTDSEGKIIGVLGTYGDGAGENRSRLQPQKEEDIASLKEAQADLKAYADKLSHLYQSEKELREREETQKKALEMANAQLKCFANDLNVTLRELESAHLETLQCLAVVAEFKDEDTGKHILRISRYSELLARKLGLPDNEVRKIALASPMHDIGKVGVPDAILHKTGELTGEEFEQIKLHTVVGEKILKGSKSPVAQMAREIALSHHEKWDGTGYPKGLAGQDIPLAGRIVSLADCFDALMDKRLYKDPYPKEIAITMILEEKGKSFDPEIVETFAANFEEILSIFNGLKSAHVHDFRKFKLSERDRNGYPLYAVRKPAWKNEQP